MSRVSHHDLASFQEQEGFALGCDLLQHRLELMCSLDSAEIMAFLGPAFDCGQERGEQWPIGLDLFSRAPTTTAGHSSEAPPPRHLGDLAQRVAGLRVAARLPAAAGHGRQRHEPQLGHEGLRGRPPVAEDPWPHGARGRCLRCLRAGASAAQERLEEGAHMHAKERYCQRYWMRLLIELRG